MRLGTRGSPLALAQANAVGERLRRLGLEVTVVPMRTEGDRLAEKRLAAIGGKGLFVRDIEEALLRKEIDAAVHSLKDLPAEIPQGLTLAAAPERDDPRDVLVCRSGRALSAGLGALSAGLGALTALRTGALVGTSSPRRRAILLSLRPDVTVEPIRGNVDTRLRKLDDGGWDAVILAAAGLRRLGLSPDNAEPLDPEVFIPAVGQGIIAVEARQDDGQSLQWLAAIDDPTTRVCALAERACLARLGASCLTPMAAHARAIDGHLALAGLVASQDGQRVLRATASGKLADAERIGRDLAESLLADGAASIAALRPAEAH